jgi:hypothetical protein
MQYHYIYKITLLLGSLKDCYYYGKHTTQAKPENCGYAGSGVIVTGYFKKYGKEKGVSYTIEIVELNPDKYTNAKREKWCIGQHLEDSMCLNLSVGGMGGGVPGHTVSEETRKKLSEKLKGHKKFLPEGYHLSEEQKRKIGDANRGKSRCKGRPSPMKGRHHTEEARRKMSEKSKGRVVSEETREKMRNAYNPNRFKKGDTPWNYGIAPSEETRQKLSEKLTGRIIPEEVVKKRADAQRGRKNSEEVIKAFREQKRDKMKKIIATNIETGSETLFESVAEASRELKICRSCVIGVLKHKEGRTQASGYVFRYAEEEKAA